MKIFIGVLIFTLLPRVSSAIMGGHPVYPGEPLEKSIINLSPSDDGHSGCTGVVIDKDMVLTAAHCFTNHFGDMNPDRLNWAFFGLSERNGWGNRVRIPRGAAIYHPEYEEALRANPDWKNIHDLAVVHFRGGVPFGYKPIDLIAEENFALPPGEQLRVLGYGSDGDDWNYLLQLQHVPLAKAEQNYTKTQISLLHHRRGMFFRGTCWGDSGGPALWRDENSGKYTLVGINSFFFFSDDWNQCASSTATVFTRVNKYLGFIEEAKRELRSRKL